MYEFSSEDLWRGWNWTERFPAGRSCEAIFATSIRSSI